MSLDMMQAPIIKSAVAFDDAHPCLILNAEDGSFLQKGEYLLMIDFRWNQVAEDNAVLRKVTITVSSPAPSCLRKQ